MYVYLFRADGGLYKIGKSQSPEIRLRAFSGLPFGVQIDHKIQSKRALWLEGLLHAHFARRCVSGEWFRLGPAEVQLIRSMLRCDSEADLPPAIRQTVVARPLPISSSVWRERLWKDALTRNPLHMLEVGRKMKAARETAGLTLRRVASRAGLRCALIALLERGVAVLTLSRILAVARAVDVDPRELYGEQNA